MKILLIADSPIVAADEGQGKAAKKKLAGEHSASNSAQAGGENEQDFKPRPDAPVEAAFGRLNRGNIIPGEVTG